MSRRSKSAMNVFLMRELRQAAHLRKALRGHHQKTYSFPGRELARLRRARVKALLAHNPSSRCRWLRAVIARLSRLIGARPPAYILHQPLYFVTIIDGRQVINPDLEMNSHEQNPSWKAIRSAYLAHLRGFDYVGMLDSALYVSVQRTFRKNRFIHVHLHALVWNTTDEALEAVKIRVQRDIQPLFSYTHAFDFAPINAADFLQVAWYVHKTPRKQYQVHVRKTGRWAQYKRNINGVNAVRLYQVMHDVTLSDLALAGGAGVKLLQHVLQDVQRRR